MLLYVIWTMESLEVHELFLGKLAIILWVGDVVFLDEVYWPMVYTECKYGGPLGRPGTSCLKARLVRPWCFVLTTRPQKSLASSSIWSVLFRYTRELLCSWMSPEGSDDFHSRENVIFFSVSPIASQGKTDEGKEFTIAEGTEEFVRSLHFRL